MQRFAGLAVAVLLTVVATDARADVTATTVVFVPASGDARADATLARGLRASLAGLPGLEVRAATKIAVACAQDPACSAKAAARLGATRVVTGVLRKRGGGTTGFAFTVLVVDVAGAHIVDRVVRELSEADLATAPGETIATTLALAEPAAPRASTAKSPPTQVSSRTGQASGSGSAEEPAWRLALRSGLVVPFGDLSLGALVALEVSRDVRRRLRVSLTFDWSRLLQQDDTFLGPVDFPRARTMLIQETNLWSAHVGASYDLVEFGPAALFVGAGLGLSVDRSRFAAFSMTRDENDVSVLLVGRVGVRGDLGERFWWGLQVSGRENRADLNAPGDFGESTMSGFVMAAAIGARM